MEKPLMSIVFAARDTDENLENSWRSCVNQSYGNKELILVDHGTSDHVKQLLGDRVENPIRWISCPNENRSVALNRGIAEAGGEYVLCVQGGQEIHEQWLEKALELFARSSADAVRCATMYVDDEKIAMIDIPSESASWYRKLLRAPQFELHAVMIRRAACGIFPEDAEGILAEWEYWLQSLRGKKLFPWGDYIGSVVHAAKPQFVGQEDASYRKQLLKIMVSHRDEVRGFGKLGFGFSVRKLYDEYARHVAAGTVDRDLGLETALGKH